MRGGGIEPPSLSGPDPKSGASAKFRHPRLKLAVLILSCIIKKSRKRGGIHGNIDILVDLNQIKPIIFKIYELSELGRPFCFNFGLP